MKFLKNLHPKIIIAVAITVGALMIGSAFIELEQSKSEILHLLNEQSNSLIGTVVQSSINALNSSEEIENLVAERLFNNASLIRSLDSLNLLTHKKLVEIGKENDLYRINIFEKNGNRILSNRVPEPDHPHGEENVNRSEELKPILKNGLNRFVIGLKEAEYVDEQRFAVAIARSNKRGAIVLNLNAAQFLEFRKRIGLGKIIRDLSENRGIEYLVLQDSIGILAAGASVDSISSIESDPFLVDAFSNDKIYTRMHPFKDHEVYETVKRLVYKNEFIGIYRLGLSLDEFTAVEQRMYRRIIIISLVLATIAIIILSVFFTNQNLKSVSDEYKRFKTFASTILENMGEAVIVINSQKIITLFNKASEDLFGKLNKDVLNSNLESVSKNISESFDLFIKSKETIDFEIQTIINDKVNYLGLNFTENLAEKNEEKSYTIVINNLTEKRKLEEDSKRKEKLSAMGELASGVAHEIRNPINAIGMIAQRLNKEFKVENDKEDYNHITTLLRDEIKRINKIISQFLNYAKPLDLQIREVDSKEYFDDIFSLFEDQAKNREITFTKSSVVAYKIKIDPELIKQALMNLIQNSFDAITTNGKVELKYYKTNTNLIIEISDNGKGIPEEIKNKIFDLYFTTRNEGTGLGLSITQKIISEHNGRIEVFSQPNVQTKFTITLPQS